MMPALRFTLPLFRLGASDEVRLQGFKLKRDNLTFLGLAPNNLSPARFTFCGLAGGDGVIRHCCPLALQHQPRLMCQVSN